MKTFVLGDIHGAYKALIQCFKRSAFDYHKDRLIALGDVCDRGPDVRVCMDELMKIEHLDYILGNHDQWTLEWATSGVRDDDWLSQGGMATIDSFAGAMPRAYIDFLENARPWIKEEGRIFVHGGFDPSKPIESQGLQTLCWDRKLIRLACQKHQISPRFRFANVDEIYLGHTQTVSITKSDKPLKFCNVIAMDTGAASTGKLTIMDVETKQYWQSDTVNK